MQKTQIFQFVASDHPITYTYQKVIIELKDGKCLHGFFDRNDHSLLGQQFLSNSWNFTITPDLKEINIPGIDIESISLFEKNSVAYHVSEKGIFDTPSPYSTYRN